MVLNIILKTIGNCSFFKVKPGDIQHKFHITLLTNKHVINKNIFFLFHALNV